MTVNLISWLTDGYAERPRTLHQEATENASWPAHTDQVTSGDTLAVDGFCLLQCKDVSVETNNNLMIFDT